MNPNTKKLKDNFVKISLDHYDYQLLLAHAEKAGIEVATLARELAISKLHTIMFNDQPIAMILPSKGVVELPFSTVFGTDKPQRNNRNNNSSQLCMPL